MRRDDHAAVLKVWSKRYQDLGRTRTQVACRLHQVLCELIPGGIPAPITAGQAARILASITPAGAAPWLPALLALSASSPFWLGTDTGYASYRTLIWRRWPTAGPLPGFEPAADHDQTVADLIRSGVITDPGMIYFGIRPSAHLPTPEVRISDSCTRLKDVVLLAGLFRALVTWATAAECEGRPRVPVRPELLEAATWRAAQSGLQGDLVDPVNATAVPAGRLIGQLLAELRPALESAGDWQLVTGLTKAAPARGCSAARQRTAHASGGLRNVVDTLAAETRATPPWLQGTRQRAQPSARPDNRAGRQHNRCRHRTQTAMHPPSIVRWPKPDVAVHHDPPGGRLRHAHQTRSEPRPSSQARRCNESASCPRLSSSPQHIAADIQRGTASKPCLGRLAKIALRPPASLPI